MQENVDEILIPGEKRWLHYERQLTQGINLNDKTIESLSILAGKVDVQTPW